MPTIYSLEEECKLSMQLQKIEQSAASREEANQRRIAELEKKIKDDSLPIPPGEWIFADKSLDDHVIINPDTGQTMDLRLSVHPLMDVSLDGKYILTTTDAQQSLCMVYRDGRRKIIYHSDAVIFNPLLSPDNSRIVFTSFPINRGLHSPSDLFILDKRVQPALVDSGVKNFTPQWSPNGEKIMYIKERADSDDIEICFADRNGNKLGSVTSQKGSGSHYWQHYYWLSDYYILFRDKEGKFKGFSYPAGKEKPAVMPGEVLDPNFPLYFSPDRHYVAVKADCRYHEEEWLSGYQMQIFELVNPTYSQMVCWHLGINNTSTICWSQDSKRMAFLHEGVLRIKDFREGKKDRHIRIGGNYSLRHWLPAERK